MLKTRMTKKLEEMKNGGYTLFSDKVRKLLIAMSLSLLSIGTLSQVANAQVTADVMFKSGEFGEGNAKTIRYQMTLEEDTNNLEGIYYENGVTKIVPIVGSVEGKKTMVVIEVPSDTEKIIVKNDNEYPENNVDNIEIDLTEVSEEKKDDQGPQIVPGSLVRYTAPNGSSGSYIQAKFTDATKIYRIEDQDNHDRAIIKEKDKGNEIVLKYILDDEDGEGKDTSFKIYDILGNSTTVSLEDAVNVEVTYNMRNISGTQMVFKVTKEFTEDNTEYTLSKMITGAGEEISINVSDDDVVYTNIPAGTTKLTLTYSAPAGSGKDDKIVSVPLVLDKDAPVVIAYKSTKLQDTEYEVIESTEEVAKARAYFNKDKKKGIVEVKDIKSGIHMIKTLKGKTGSYEEEGAAVYEDKTLKPSVLCLFSVTEKTTAVRVYDGVGNTIDIPLGLADEQDAVTVATIVKEGGVYKLVAQDIKAGLGKITRSESELVNFETPQTIDEVYYKEYTLDRFEMTVTDKGDPIICVYDALGNKREVSFDEFAYMCHYATFNTSGSLSISVQDSRGIEKIEITMTDLTGGEEPVIKEQPQSERITEELDPDAEDYLEKKAIVKAWKEYDDSVLAWEDWNEQHRHEYILEVFGEGQKPEELTKTYQIPDGIVEQVRVYNENGQNIISDALINISNVTPADRLKTTSSDITKNSAGTQIVGAKVTAKFGIKSVEYTDGCVVRFYDELPTELYVNCLIATKQDGEQNETDEAVFTGATITDALGDTLIIESEKVTFSYNNKEINI